MLTTQIWSRSLITYFNTILFGGWGKKTPYPSGFFKYLQNHLLIQLEIFRVWFSDYLKAVLKNVLKIGVRKAWITPFLGWHHIEKNLRKIFCFFSKNFSLFVISMLCLLVKTIKYSLLLFTEMPSIIYIKKW